jgi:hypothetical protein
MKGSVRLAWTTPNRFLKLVEVFGEPRRGLGDVGAVVGI